MPSFSFIRSKASQLSGGNSECAELAGLVEALARKCEELEKKATDAERQAKRALTEARK